MAHSDGGRLSHVHRESATVARLLGTSPVIDVDAKRDRLAQAGESASVIHLAAHGDFRAANPLFSSIRMADGELTTLDVFNLRLNAQLVTLSACETGRSVVAGGDELIGLARAFVYAGARSLVLTLWAVSDEATCQLMETFYAALVKGQGIPQSLRLAQLDLLHGGPTGYSHPYYWSAFYHVGDPSRSRLTLGG
jgi:CHAT domain-containing protein